MYVDFKFIHRIFLGMYCWIQFSNTSVIIPITDRDLNFEPFHSNILAIQQIYVVFGASADQNMSNQFIKQIWKHYSKIHRDRNRNRTSLIGNTINKILGSSAIIQMINQHIWYILLLVMDCDRFEIDCLTYCCNVPIIIAQLSTVSDNFLFKINVVYAF